MTNRSHLDDGRVCREMVDEFAPSKFLASVQGMVHDQLLTEFNVRVARQMSLSAKVRMDKEIGNVKAHMVLKEAEAAEAICLCAEASNFVTMEKSLRDEVNDVNERNTIFEKDRDALDVKVADLEASVVTKEREMTDLNARLTSVKSHNNSLVDQVHELKVASQLKVVNDKFDRLYADFVKMALHLEERFYPHLLTTIFGHRWLLIHGIELAITKFLHSTEYLSALGADIGKAIEKGMQDGLSAGIIHGLGSKKDASVDTVMNILRLEETLVERLGLNESQPYVDQLMVPIHQLPDQVVVGASALSLALDVSSSRVQKIKENITNHRSALRDVFVPLAEPLSDDALIGTKGTSNVISATADTTMALSTTLASVSIVAPIAVDD
nr:hypothetical protein [Tanacetum cinerariifolium]